MLRPQRAPTRGQVTGTRWTQNMEQQKKGHSSLVLLGMSPTGAIVHDTREIKIG